MPSTTAVIIGNFDGVHAGHAALVRRARELADRAAFGSPGARVAAMVFHPHPLTILRPESAPEMLMTFERRAELLRAMGVDDVVRLEPRPEILRESPAEFIDSVFARFNPCAIVEGRDFRFGKGRSGDVGTLAELCAARGSTASIVEPVTVALSDQSIITASSSMVRWLIRHGRVDDAARVLARPFELTGTVVRGDRRGRELGFPTANLSAESLLPLDGVYAGWAVLPDARRLAAAIHVGTRSTFDNDTRTVEAYILDWAGPVAEGAAEYGWALRLEFAAYLRDQARFETINALVEQIRRDVERVRALTQRAGSRARMEFAEEIRA